MKHHQPQNPEAATKAWSPATPRVATTMPSSAATSSTVEIAAGGRDSLGVQPPLPSSSGAEGGLSDSAHFLIRRAGKPAALGALGLAWALWSVMTVAALAQSIVVRIQSGQFRPFYQLVDSRKPEKGAKPVPVAQLVTVANFSLDVDSVTNEEYLDFVTKNPKWRKSAVSRIYADANYLKDWTGDLSFPASLKGRPVTYVSWFSARSFARFHGKRLPTQNEWEFVGRADEGSKDGTGSSGFNRRILEWYGRPNSVAPPRVSDGFLNVYGVRGMHGCIWEWVEDFNSVLIGGESRTGSNLDKGLFCAAGVNGSADPSNYAAYMRHAFRFSLKANYCVANLGFRCAKDQEKKP